jgi:hypothetical protein
MILLYKEDTEGRALWGRFCRTMLILMGLALGDYEGTFSFAP